LDASLLDFYSKFAASSRLDRPKIVAAFLAEFAASTLEQLSE